MILKSRIKRFSLTIIIPFLAISAAAQKIPPNHSFEINGNLTIVYDGKGSMLDSISAHLLAADIEKVTDLKPTVSKKIPVFANDLIVIGNIESAFIQNLFIAGNPDLNILKNEWERFCIKTVSLKGNTSKRKCLLITGSDDRGTAFGVLEVSKRIGVSPWNWWADVPVAKKTNAKVEDLPYLSPAPSVKYRGIFINDEDWGLQPWAAKTFEPETGDIGPKTYAKVFELLLRLKANLIWPAMHPSTKAFFHYPGNIRMAKDYQIIIGTSHAEPMMRNNVDEWDEKAMGAFNYLTNKKKVFEYWEQRVKETKGLKGQFTVGMRGVHDSGMEGVKTLEETRKVLDTVISDQRAILSGILNKKPDEIPQVFTLYKEVLDVYDIGMKLPEDITLVWPDDNYGYIRRLGNLQERNRSGGTGVYYHASYWGRPHDYLWLSSTHPALMRQQMMQAYNMDAQRLWVLNVGDIKPQEYNMQLFLDMAYHAEPFQESTYTKQHFSQWHQDIFGIKNGEAIARNMWQYYDLAFERKPEFMGWSQTEPTRPVEMTTYQHFSYGDEAEKRLAAYEKLEKEIQTIRDSISPEQYPAFFQLAWYPVRGAALMNQKYLYRDKALHYAKQGRFSANGYMQKAENAHQEIIKETSFYNNELSGGKWNHMMDMAPRRLPVFQALNVLPDSHWVSKNKVGLDLESPYYFSVPAALPTFNSWIRQAHFFDVYLNRNEQANWKATPSHDWIKMSHTGGVLNPADGFGEQRVWVEIDWDKINSGQTIVTGTILFESEELQFPITVRVENRPPIPSGISFAESDHLVVMYAANFTRKENKPGRFWHLENDLGHSGTVMKAEMPDLPDSISIIQDVLPFMSYDFFTHHSSSKPTLSLVALPTHPLTNQFSVRVGVSIDDGPMEILDFKTEGRSETWKQNVLQNKAILQKTMGTLVPGKHTLKVFMIDPGVLLDYIYIQLDKVTMPYSVLHETTLFP